MSDIMERIQKAIDEFPSINEHPTELFKEIKNEFERLEKENAELRKESEIWEKHSLVAIVKERDELREKISSTPKLSLTEHDKEIIADLEILAQNPDNGFWPRAIALGTHRLIKAAYKDVLK